MSSAKDWISAFRLRTLFLAVSSVILGSSLAWSEGMFSVATFILALVLAVSAQILSNLANDLGDFQKGTDTTGNRKGPVRAVQSGHITANKMKRAVIIMALWVAAIGSILLLSVIYEIGLKSVLILLLSGCFAFWQPYVTHSENMLTDTEVGEIFCIYIFGPVPVIGTYFYKFIH